MKIRGFELVNEKFRDNNKLYKLPIRQTSNSAGYDFFLPEDITINPGETVKIQSGIKAYMQENEVLYLHVRSSIGIKKHLILSNSTGVIDADYYSNETNDGDIGIVLFNYGKEPITLNKGECVIQGVFHTYLIADNGNLNNNRNGGIGSTTK